MKIALPLPARLTSHFVVPVERGPFDVESFVPWRVGVPYRRAANAVLGTALLTVTHHPAPWKPNGVTLSVEERHLLRRAREHVVVSSTAPLPGLPTSVQLARATARALARECGGLVIDPLTGITLRGCPPCSSSSFTAAGAVVPVPPSSRPAGPLPFDMADEPHGFRLADDWLGWDVQVHADATCPPWDPADTGACDCLRVTSRGLHRFALPEITLDGAACAHSLCATGLLRRVAHRLVTDHLSYLATHPDTGERLIDDHLRIEAPLSPDERAGSPFTVRLTPCDTDPAAHGRVTRLKVAPPPTAQAARRVPAPRTGPDRLARVALAPGSPQITSPLALATPPPARRVTHLKVGPPLGFTGSLNDWLCATQRPAAAASHAAGYDLTDPSSVLAA
ncbi:hypothetical protein [Nonomuraea rhizosphaerae]|uniref:hypothetical protein n=1 Tax=Nonomuraea rhizosphaerae TaxID=2665663 RepID=UPI001C6076AC|nr:hypothetical protein [Nonomuraea rhizosphaerae]